MPSERENQKEELGKRDIDLEDIVGNLMIAEYQVEKLRTRVTEKIGAYGSAAHKKSLRICSNMIIDGLKFQLK